MHSDYYETLLHKHLAGELSGEEQRDLEGWLDESPEHRRRLEEAERVWALTEFAGSELELDLGSEIDRFKQRVGLAESSMKVVPLKSRFVWRYAAAAVLLIGAMAVLFLRNGWNGADDAFVIATGEGETRQTTLPDGSIAWLNEQSRLTYDPDFEFRSLTLEGEAFFEVIRDESRPFEVESGRARVRVLGTSFSVRRHSDEVRVLVATGRVALSLADSDQREELTPGYLGMLDEVRGTVTSRPNTDPSMLAWRASPLSFETAPFGDVVEALRAHFAIAVETPDSALAACTFTGSFEAPSLTEILESIEFSLNIEASVQQGVYAFSGIGCSP